MLGIKITSFLVIFWVSLTILGKTNAIDAKNQIEPFVYKGMKAKEGQFPFMAVVNVKRTYTYIFCGGAILTPEYILTAGHCVVNGNMILYTHFTLYFGQVENLTDNPNWIDRKSNKAILHEDYYFNGVIAENDLAVIVLDEKLDFGPTIQPVQFPTEAYNEVNNLDFTAIGWGRTESSYPASNALMYTTLQGITNEECELLSFKLFNYSLEIDHGMVCMKKEETGLCPGDSGSPLVAMGTNILVGIANWAPFRCKMPSVVNGFARISYHLDWIKSKIGETETN